MKTNRICLVFAAATAALTLTTVAIAQSKAANEDGIAASPKVRQMLNERKASARPASIAAVPAMACSKCTDRTTIEPNRNAKGAEVLAGADTKTVTRHGCGGCEVKLATVGEGKARHTVATHKCTADVPNNLACCASN